MKQFINVLKFELGNYFKSKSYMTATIIISVALGLGLCVPTVFNIPIGGNTASESSSGGDTGEESNDDKDTWGIYDKAGIISEDVSLDEIFPNQNINIVGDEETLREMVTSEDASAGFVLNSMTDYTYLVNNTKLYDTKQYTFEEGFLNIYRYASFTKQGLDYSKIMSVVNTPVTSTQEILGKDGAGNYFYAYFLLFIIYFVVLLYGQMIATSITSEKSNRAIEVLVTSTSSNSLIFGKVIAGAIASIFQVGIILGASLISYRFNHEAWGGILDIVFAIPADVLIVFAFFGIFGYIFCAFIYGALGALVSKTEDISKSATPIMLIVMVGFFLALIGLNMGDSLLVKISSFIPLFSFYTMIVRVAVSTVPIWEIIISFLLLLLTTAGIGVVAAKIYRAGTLMYGNPIKLKNAFKLIKHDK